jgi:hypothetical protein
LVVRRDNKPETLSQLGDELFSAPLGPFLVFTGWPPEEAFFILKVATTVSLLALLLGVRTIFFSYFITFLLIAEAGFRYSTGKIDHDIVLLILPALLAKSWGQVMALIPSIPKPYNPRPLAWVIGFYFFSSGFIKLWSGYFDLSQQAIAGWLEFYIINYGFAGPLATHILGLPNTALESLDWVAVIFECSMLVFMLKPKLLKMGLILALMFHSAVFLTFGIDFLKLVIAYMALIAVKVPFPPRKISIKSGLFLVAITVFAATFYETGIAWLSASLSGLLSYLFFLIIGLGAGVVLISSPASEVAIPRKQLKIHRLIVGVFLFFPLVMTIAWTEPYPAVIGPGFRAGVSGDFVFKVFSQGVPSDPSSALMVPMPYAQNLLFYLFPPPHGQGHETRPIVQKPEEGSFNFEGVWEKSVSSTSWK